MTKDYRDALKPNGPYLSILSPFRRRIVELFTRGYSRDEIARITGRENKRHATDVMILNCMLTLHVDSHVELMLLAYGMIDGRTLGLNLDDKQKSFGDDAARDKCPHCLKSKVKKANSCWDCHLKKIRNEIG